MDTNVTPNKIMKFAMFLLFYYFLYREILGTLKILLQKFLNTHTQKKKKSYHATNLVEITLIFKSIYKLFVIKLR